MQYVDVVSCLWFLFNSKLFIYRHRRRRPSLLKVPIKMFEWRCLQNEDGVENTFENTNYSFWLCFAKIIILF